MQELRCFSRQFSQLVQPHPPKLIRSRRVVPQHVVSIAAQNCFRELNERSAIDHVDQSLFLTSLFFDSAFPSAGASAGSAAATSVTFYIHDIFILKTIASRMHLYGDVISIKRAIFHENPIFECKTRALLYNYIYV